MYNNSLLYQFIIIYLLLISRYLLTNTWVEFDELLRQQVFVLVFICIYIYMGQLLYICICMGVCVWVYTYMYMYVYVYIDAYRYRQHMVIKSFSIKTIRLSTLIRTLYSINYVEKRQLTQTSTELSAGTPNIHISHLVHLRLMEKVLWTP